MSEYKIGTLGDSPYIGKIMDLPTIDISDFILGGEKKIVFGPDRFWPSHTMRCMIFNVGSRAPKHSHPWMHWAIVFSGKGCIAIDGVEYHVEGGTYVHIPPNVEHEIWNTSDTEPFVWLCTVESQFDVNPLTGQPVGC